MRICSPRVSLIRPPQVMCQDPTMQKLVQSDVLKSDMKFAARLSVSRPWTLVDPPTPARYGLRV